MPRNNLRHWNWSLLSPMPSRIYPEGGLGLHLSTLSNNPFKVRYICPMCAERYYKLHSSSKGNAGLRKPVFSSIWCTSLLNIHIYICSSKVNLMSVRVRMFTFTNGYPPFFQTLALSSPSVNHSPAKVWPCSHQQVFRLKPQPESDWLDRDEIYSAPQLILSSHGWVSKKDRGRDSKVERVRDRKCHC